VGETLLRKWLSLSSAERNRLGTPQRGPFRGTIKRPRLKRFTKAFSESFRLGDALNRRQLFFEFRRGAPSKKE
jgi:hypothetical protein